MKLPNSRKAIVEVEKLRDYSLNANHPVGRHKARVFARALGITLQDAEWLRERVLEVAVSGEAKLGPESVFGTKYLIDSTIKLQGKSAVVRFAWIVESGTDFPRLTSCWVK